jgi:hypothetical protein
MWLCAEATAMRILGERPGIGACRQFARGAIGATSIVITAKFGEALAETSRWQASLRPPPAALRQLRAVLAQLSVRVDVRDGGVTRTLHAERKRRLPSSFCASGAGGL